MRQSINFKAWQGGIEPTGKVRAQRWGEGGGKKGGERLCQVLGEWAAAA